MRITHLTWLLSGAGGGIPPVVFAVDGAQRALGHEVFVTGVEDPRSPPLGQAAVFRALGPLALGFAPGMLKSLADRNPKVIHLHGLFTWTSRVTLAAGKRVPAPVVVTPHGMLDPWALGQSRWKKRVFRALVEDANLAQAACLQALCEAEVAHFRRFGLRNPIAVVPNGVTIPEPVSAQAFVSRFPAVAGRRVLLFLGRIHPKKGLPNLIDAWRAVKRATKAARDWIVVVAGPDQLGHAAEVERRALECDLEADVLLIGPVHGVFKESVLSGASGFVLPSFSEGLPMAVLEAMARRIPVVITRECNLDVERIGAGVLADATVESIAHALEEFLAASDDDRRTMGDRGWQEIQSRYTWDRVARDLVAAYSFALGTGPRPSFVVES
jgi:poly(glycerol-phosphate) alpha-glucosyltransferase